MSNSYDWKFCKIGGVTRVNITSGKDIAHLDELDQKLWTALSCPVAGLEFDEKTLNLMDSNNDGKIRVNEVKAAAKWLTSIVKNADIILKQTDSISLDEINTDTDDGARIHKSAKQILSNLGLEDHTEITLADASDSVAIFAKTQFNGDGVITEQSTDDADLKDVIASAVASFEGADDRCGTKGINADILDKFYAACADFKAWKDADTADIRPFGDDTAAALDACNAIKDKVADYFMRCKLAAFNNESTAALDISAARIGEISSKDLVSCNDEISAYPIARVTGKNTLTLDCSAINPAWQAAFDKAKKLAIDPSLPFTNEITEAQWNSILAKFDAFTAWNAAKKGAEVEALGLEKIEKILNDDNKNKLVELIDKDKSFEQESADIDSVEKFLRYLKYFYKLLKNFVTLTDFYARDEKNLPVFQAGTLFIDQRSTELCIKVADMGKQGEVSDLSGMYILYCDCTSKVKNAKLNIAAILTEGDTDSIRVGKNAVFYDRDGHDWDAVVTKIVDNPISVKQAFWSPYKKFARFISERIDKAAADKNAKVDTAVAEKANTTEVTTKEGVESAKGAATGFDIAKFTGIFAAIGLAVGFIGQAIVSLATGLTAHWYNPILALLAIILLVSGPSMFIAWRKLRRRDFAPILNANGWAINSRILVNSKFGATFTKLAQYPKVSDKDPYAQPAVWPKVLATILLLAVVTVGALHLTKTINVVDIYNNTMEKLLPAPAPEEAAPADAPADAAPAPAPAE